MLEESCGWDSRRGAAMVGDFMCPEAESNRLAES